MCVVTACLYTDRPVLPRIAGIMIWGMPFRSQCVMTNLWYEVTFDENGHMQFTLEPAWKRWVDPPDENAPLPDSLKRWWDPPEDGRPAAFKPGCFSPDLCGRCDWCGWWGYTEWKHGHPDRFKLEECVFADIDRSPLLLCQRCLDLLVNDKEPPWRPNCRDRCHEWLQQVFRTNSKAARIVRIHRKIAQYLAENKA